MDAAGEERLIFLMTRYSQKAWEGRVKANTYCYGLESKRGGETSGMREI